MRYFTKETEQVMIIEIVRAIASFDKSQTKLKITYIDDPQPTAWAFSVYRQEFDTIEIMIASRE